MGVTAFLLDLDGVICDTAKYHFLAWKALADRLGIPFTETDNERLKGVSRMGSLEILLSLGDGRYTEAEKEAFAAEKNAAYVSCIQKMTRDELLPGVLDFLAGARALGLRVGLGSVSKNAPLILDRLQITERFDSIVDGTRVGRAKPDPEVFLAGARDLGVRPAGCVVFEDAFEGVRAARAAGMHAVGIGDSFILREADLVLPGFSGITPEELLRQMEGL